MTSSFWKIPLQAESKKYTAFQHRGKSYEFNVVPFGLKTGTAVLIRGLDHVLQGISLVDDTLITSESAKQHLEHLKELLTRLEKNNVTLNSIVLMFLKSSLIIIYLLRNFFNFLKWCEIILNSNIEVRLFVIRS